MKKTKQLTNNKVLGLVSKNLKKLGFCADMASYEDFINNRTSIVKFIKNEDKKCSITINLDTKSFSNTMLWSSKLTLRQEVTILNLLLTNVYSILAKEGISNEKV